MLPSVNMDGSIIQFMTHVIALQIILNEEQVAIIENIVLYTKWPTITEEHSNNRLKTGFRWANIFREEEDIFNYQNI